MDGDAAPLKEIVALKEKHGAWLMVDEAHATGLYGEHRRGLAEKLGVGGRIEIQMGTLGKALGAGGGYICGSRALVEFLVNRARSFIFSTAPVPAAAAAATAAIQLVQSGVGERQLRRLAERIAESWSGLSPELRRLLPQHKTRSALATPPCLSAIVPLIVGDEVRAVECFTKLQRQSIFVPAIRYPTVARGAARLRVTLTAAHAAGDVTRLILALDEIINRKS
jgi:7-keto-8-aminopelargonate synthetase-like enzyme